LSYSGAADVCWFSSRVTPFAHGGCQLDGSALNLGAMSSPSESRLVSIETTRPERRRYAPAARDTRSLR
jgi:hypothetical protein